MKSIYLTGFMGSGKTTIGKLLAEKWQVRFIDTDQYIEEKLNKTIREIFAVEGEAQFRKYEEHYLQMLPVEDAIITTGGGIVINETNRQWMKDHGIVIFLHCDPEVILKRLEDDSTRPLLDGDKRSNIQRIYGERLDFYKEAHYLIDTTMMRPDQIVAEIEMLLHINK